MPKKKDRTKFMSAKFINMFPLIKIYHIKDSKTREETVRSWPYSFQK